MKIMVGSALLLVALLSFGASLGAAHGQSPLVFGIQPAQNSIGAPSRGAYFTYTLEPGARVDDTAVVTNSGKETAVLTLYAADSITAINGSTAFADLNQERDGQRSWLSTTATLLEVPPGAALRVPFTVQVPAAATPGDHVAGWVVQAPPKQASGGFGASVLEHAGVAVVVRVPGPTKTQLALGNICLNQETGSNYFEVSVRNEGNVLSHAEGTFILSTKQGREVFSRAAELGNVIPGDGTVLRLDAPLDPGPGEYAAKVALRQSDGQDIEAGSDIKIGDKKVNGCLAVAAASENPSGSIIPHIPAPPGGNTPWLVLSLLVVLLAVLVAARQYIMRRWQKAGGKE